MECNKEEAIRVLDFAENRFKSNDFEGAKTLALKAQKLFSSLPNLEKYLTAYEVHMAATAQNWHAVLRVNTTSDHDTIKKQFKNMCLLTHPDKNPSAAAEGAFKLVTRAWSILSTSSNSTSYFSTSRSSSDSSSSQSSDWKNIRAEMKCKKCRLSCYWDYCKMQDDTSLFHKCKICGACGMIRVRLATTKVPLACSGCKTELNWGVYRPFGYECYCCKGYYVAGMDPKWMLNSCYSVFFEQGLVLCPFCGCYNRYEMENGKSFVSCKQCGLKSVIQLENESSSSRSSQSEKRRREY